MLHCPCVSRRVVTKLEIPRLTKECLVLFYVCSCLVQCQFTFWIRTLISSSDWNPRFVRQSSWRRPTESRSSTGRSRRLVEDNTPPHPDHHHHHQDNTPTPSSSSSSSSRQHPHPILIIIIIKATPPPHPDHHHHHQGNTPTPSWSSSSSSSRQHPSPHPHHHHHHHQGNTPTPSSSSSWSSSSSSCSSVMYHELYTHIILSIHIVATVAAA